MNKFETGIMTITWNGILECLQATSASLQLSDQDLYTEYASKQCDPHFQILKQEPRIRSTVKITSNRHQDESSEIQKILNKRKELQIAVNTEREKERLAILQYGKIIFLKNQNTDSERSRLGKKKRNQSSSPESIEDNRDTNKVRKAAKNLNKNNHIDKYLTKATNSKRPALEDGTASLNIAE
ncbi:unnamed protein product [Pieris macdunnoughi]|uniref:Uncharacterized protein n=1 Tax=Pieris macdunnoughi TaxID=345717 RepID=A0A821QZM9_9NEOP|nr:unnamed protein product [Pieris macdunnoughi]